MGVLPRHPKKRRAVFIIVMLVLLAMVIFNRVLRAEVAIAEDAVAGTLVIECGSFTPSRAELAMAFLRLERAYVDDEALAGRLTPAVNREANRMFDRATGEFFRGDTRRVPAMLARVTSMLLGESAAIADRRAALSQIRIAGHDASTGLHGFWPPRITVPAGVDAASLEGITLALIDARTSETLASLSIDETGEPTPGGGQERDPLRADPDRAGDFEITARLGHAVEPIVVSLARWSISANDLAEVHAENALRIEALAERQPGLSEHTLGSLGYRNDLLLGGDWRPELTPIVLDLPRLRDELADDLRRAEQGDDPFRERVGEHVRAVQHHTGLIPIRVYAPSRRHDDHTPLPVVIAFHGAGVDEHLWFLGYGGGKLARLAEEHGFLLVAPRAYTFMTDISRFDALLEAIKASYEIDPARITIIGHSMGGVLCTAIAQARPDLVAGAVGIAGARWINPEQPIAPMRFYVPEFDPIVPPGRVRGPAARALEAGLPVQTIEVPDQGHTLVVPAVLDDAVDWLLSRRLGE